MIFWIKICIVLALLVSLGFDFLKTNNAGHPLTVDNINYYYKTDISSKLQKYVSMSGARLVIFNGEGQSKLQTSTIGDVTNYTIHLNTQVLVKDIDTGKEYYKKSSNFDRKATATHELLHLVHYSNNIITGSYVHQIAKEFKEDLLLHYNNNPKIYNDNFYNLIRDYLKRKYKTKPNEEIMDSVTRLAACHVDIMCSATDGNFLNGATHPREYYVEDKHSCHYEIFAQSMLLEFGVDNPIMKDLDPRLYKMCRTYNKMFLKILNKK